MWYTCAHGGVWGILTRMHPIHTRPRCTSRTPHTLASVACALALLVSGCAEGAWRRSVEVSLDVTRIAVDGSWALTIEHQASAEEAIILDGAARAVGLEPVARQAILEEVQQLLLLVRQRHHVWYSAFATIRHLHEAAVAAYEAYRNGRGTRAAFFAAMTPLLEAWRELQELLPNRGQPDVPGPTPGPLPSPTEETPQS